MPSNIVLALCVTASALVSGVSVTHLLTNDIDAGVDAGVELDLGESVGACTTPCCPISCEPEPAPTPTPTPAPPAHDHDECPAGTSHTTSDNDVVDAKDAVDTGDITIIGDDAVDLENVDVDILEDIIEQSPIDVL